MNADDDVQQEIERLTKRDLSDRRRNEANAADLRRVAEQNKALRELSGGQ